MSCCSQKSCCSAPVLLSAGRQGEAVGQFACIQMPLNFRLGDTRKPSLPAMPANSKPGKRAKRPRGRKQSG